MTRWAPIRHRTATPGLAGKVVEVGARLRAAMAGAGFRDARSTKGQFDDLSGGCVAHVHIVVAIHRDAV
jgi:hypothetical protein